MRAVGRGSMLQDERLRKMKEHIDRKIFCSLGELCETFRISRATAHRDLILLADANRVRLVRGGASTVSDGTTYDPPYSVKMNLHPEEKARIADLAFQQIHEGETVILDSGTTALCIAERIKSAHDIKVATNDVRIAASFANTDGVDVTVIGGSLRKGYYSTLGYFAQMTLEHIHADIAFIGVDAIDAQRGFMITNTEEVSVKRLIMAAAKRRVIICDHTKFESTSFVRLCPLEEVDLVITGRELDESVRAKYAEAGARILFA
jgi:DeoR/GlpR family transcriptional regulator of sugar metabolism